MEALADADARPRLPPRSAEELAMRALIVPELRRRWPDARIVHELPLRYSRQRIDLAAICPDRIVGVEIKSSRDVVHRLEAQVRGFLPVCSLVIVALAPKWNARLPSRVEQRGACTRYVPQYTDAQDILHRIGFSTIEVWTVDADRRSLDLTNGSWRDEANPWTRWMLDMLHVPELVEIADRHRICRSKRPVHYDLVRDCAALLAGREAVAAVCRALRARDAFAEGSEPPVSEDRDQMPGIGLSNGGLQPRS